MNEKSIKSAVKAHTDAVATLQTLVDQQERCRQAITIGDDHSCEIAAIKKQRDDAIGNAYLAGTKADTSDLEKQITDLEAKTASDIDNAKAARTASELLQPKIDAAQQLVDQTQEDIVSALEEAMNAEFYAAEQSYADAIEAAKASMAQMGAAASILSLYGARSAAQRTAQYDLLITKSANEGIQKKRADDYWMDTEIIARLGDRKLKAFTEIRAKLEALGADI